MYFFSPGDPIPLAQVRHLHDAMPRICMMTPRTHTRSRARRSVGRLCHSPDQQTGGGGKPVRPAIQPASQSCCRSRPPLTAAPRQSMMRERSSSLRHTVVKGAVGCACALWRCVEKSEMESFFFILPFVICPDGEIHVVDSVTCVAVQSGHSRICCGLDPMFGNS
jgi:hypothetical protein